MIIGRSRRENRLLERGLGGGKGKRSTQLSLAVWISVSGSASRGMVKAERYPSAAAKRVSFWLGSSEGRGKLATCLTQAVGPSSVCVSEGEYLKKAGL